MSLFRFIYGNCENLLPATFAKVMMTSYW